ncbi:hypothetical protein PR001_g1718 [Phytophthora rubi]|uniref:C2H2-type domain-containing protein n=1 Tax=Phytophthora rubi TaxID=129364 RepID=A0A6A3NZQ1_9STRA|nr:hypothetical protein PR001_g1718 [Phytophthora rubi]
MQADIVTLGDAVQQIEARINNMVNAPKPKWKIGEGSWHALQSLPGGGDQHVHKVFPTFETARAILKKGMVPASVIVALMDDTQLHVYPGCFGATVEQSKRRTLQLNAGEVIVFRGDLVHAGAKHTSLNVRLHCYIQVKGIKQKPDSTEAVVFNTYMCNKCNDLLYSRRLLADHRRKCAVGSEHLRPLCSKQFRIPNSLHQHLRRKHSDYREFLRVSYTTPLLESDEEGADTHHTHASAGDYESEADESENENESEEERDESSEDES